MFYETASRLASSVRGELPRTHRDRRMGGHNGHRGVNRLWGSGFIVGAGGFGLLSRGSLIVPVVNDCELHEQFELVLIRETALWNDDGLIRCSIDEPIRAVDDDAQDVS